MSTKRVDSDGLSDEDEAEEEQEEEAPTASLGRTLVAILVSWTALVAVPGALPWAATEDAARALAFAIAGATVVAGAGLIVSLFGKPSYAATGGQIATAASTIAIFLAALEVVNLMLIPADAEYRQTAIAIGLLVLLAVALLAATSGRWTFFEGFRFSSLSLIGSLVGLALVAVYLVVIQSLFGRTGPDVLDPEWIRINDLLTGLQALAFAAVGALLGTAVQSQVTNGVKEDLSGSDAANEELDETVSGLADDAAAGRLLRVADSGAVNSAIEEALIQDQVRYIDQPVRRKRWAAGELRAVTATEPEQLATELRNTLQKARSLRHRR